MPTQIPTSGPTSRLTLPPILQASDPSDSTPDSVALPSVTARELEWWEIAKLEEQGCRCADWSRVRIEGTGLERIRSVEFIGSVSIGPLVAERSRIERCSIENCVLERDVRIVDVGLLRGLRIASGVEVERCGRVEMDVEAACGLGTEVAVLDESGSRPVVIYPGLSAQMATLMARLPRKAEQHLIPLAKEHIALMKMGFDLGAGAHIRDCGELLNVRVWPGVRIEGARRLVNGSVVSNTPSGRPAMARIGTGVMAENFIIEDGVVEGGSLIVNTFVGQGAHLDKGFTSHDSLFFANASMENGEACAVLAGPYTVSMHKSSLLIGCLTSFMNAGSATNQSNHMYKLGPVHWGILERGVKTSSNSYLMLGAKIGAFSLLMGDHKTHPDSSEFPFSYLFGDEKGATVVVPAMMLRSCGLLRDEMKWPTRDRRVKGGVPMHDRINFPVLNPHTVSHILKALDTIDKLMARPADDDRYVRYKGMKLTRASLERARMIYGLAIYKYLHITLGEEPMPAVPTDGVGPDRWVDLCGQLIPRALLEAALEKDSIKEIERSLDDARERFPHLELDWMGRRFGDYWRERRHRFALEAERFDEMVAEDREQYRDNLRAENEMLALL